MTKMVQLADDAYARLKVHKRSGESFSDVVRRLTRPSARLSEISRIGSPAEMATARKAREKINELEKERTRRSLRRRGLEQ